MSHPVREASWQTYYLYRKNQNSPANLATLARQSHKGKQLGLCNIREMSQADQPNVRGERNRETLLDDAPLLTYLRYTIPIISTYHIYPPPSSNIRRTHTQPPLPFPAYRIEKLPTLLERFRNGNLYGKRFFFPFFHSNYFPLFPTL